MAPRRQSAWRHQNRERPRQEKNGPNHECAAHRVGRAQPGNRRLLRQSARQDAQSRCPRRTRGVVFENAYCNSPICVPSRASLATGDYVHRTGYWDSAAAYDGRVPSWHHRVRAAGHDVVSIGKLHFRSAEDDNGFSAVHHPIYVVDGIGDTHGLLRTRRQVRAVARELATEAGRGPSPYTRYDATVADATVRWIHERASGPDRAPWVLFSSMVSPHYPLIAPDAFYDLYDGVALPRPRHYVDADRPDHPVIAHYRDTWNYDDFFDADRLAAGLRAYYGLCAFLDHQIGKVLRRARRMRVRRRYPRHLHVRPRREPGQPRPVGEVGDVRGGERRSPGGGGARHAGRPSDARQRSRWSTSIRPSSRRTAGRSMSASAPCPGRAWLRSRGQRPVTVSSSASCTMTER